MAIWSGLFLNDQPVAVSSMDGSTRADRRTLEENNPALRDLIPKDLDFYAYDGGLVFVAADARRWRFAVPIFTPNLTSHLTTNISGTCSSWQRAGTAAIRPGISSLGK
jgi:hypothetical protein